jgi:hypothetical protein
MLKDDIASRKTVFPPGLDPCSDPWHQIELIRKKDIELRAHHIHKSRQNLRLNFMNIRKNLDYIATLCS